MSLLVILMCFTGMAECSSTNAPLVIRKEMTTGECIAEMAKIMEQSRTGVLINPAGGYYVLRCEQLEPRA